MNKTKPINIIGAGPSGLCAAIQLSRAGYDVTVYERNPDVGMRFHGDFQGIENWSTDEDLLVTLETMSIRPDFLCEPYTRGEFFMKGGYGGTVASSKPLFYLTLRGSTEGCLDRSLKRQAQEAGVTLLFNQRKEAKDGEIVATGPRRPNVLASGVVFETDLQDTIMVYMDNRIAPWGYAYFLVRQGRATLASVYYKNFKHGFRYLDESIQLFQRKFPFAMNSAKRFTGYGNYNAVRSAVHNQRCYVGEAAGFQDFLFGFGIRYALTSGYLAAQSLIHGLSYDTLWKQAFSKPYATSLSNRYLYQVFGSLAHRFIIWGTTKKNPWRFMNRLYQSNLSRQVAYMPGERWLKKTGAAKTPWHGEARTPS